MRTLGKRRFHRFASVPGAAVAAAALLMSSGLARAAPAGPSLTLQVSAEDTPVGGTVQVKIFLAAPRQVSSGAIAIDLDPSVFGEITNVALFGAAGDVAGYARVYAGHVDAHFRSASGSIGQLPSLPVLTITVPVLAGVPAGTTSLLTLDPSGNPNNNDLQSGPAWQDPSGNTYSVSVLPATFHVGGSISVQSVSPAGGLLPRGSAIQINGTGFDSSTAVEMLGVSIASTQFVSSQQINVVLAGDTEITGKRVRLTNSAGGQIDYFPALPSVPGNLVVSAGYPSFHLMAPMAAFQSTGFAYLYGTVSTTLGLQNANLAPVTATFFSVQPKSDLITHTITVPAGALYGVKIPFSSVDYGGTYMAASAPLRMVLYTSQFVGLAYPNTESFGLAGPLTGLPSEILSAPAPSPWNWQVGTPAPGSRSVSVGSYASVDFTVSVPAAAQQWLSVTPTSGEAPTTLTLTPNVSSLESGHLLRHRDVDSYRAREPSAESSAGLHLPGCSQCHRGRVRQHRDGSACRERFRGHCSFTDDGERGRWRILCACRRRAGRTHQHFRHESRSGAGRLHA